MQIYSPEAAAITIATGKMLDEILYIGQSIGTVAHGMKCEKLP